jgi:hypothetical protein
MTDQRQSGSAVKRGIPEPRRHPVAGAANRAREVAA